MKEKFKNNKGITLVALVITIIVLLILAMVSIKIAIDGGLIGKSNETVTIHEEAKMKESVQLAVAQCYMTKEGLTAENLKKALKEQKIEVEEDNINLEDKKVTIDGKEYELEEKKNNNNSTTEAKDYSYTEEEKLEAIALIEELGLKDYVYSRADELSGGQKQRVGIARAIMQNPDLLLCDEPIASLDPSSAMITMEMLKDMTKKHNITCIANLHQVDIAKQYSTRIIGLKDGNVVFDGRPEELTAEKISEIYGTDLGSLTMEGEKKYA